MEQREEKIRQERLEGEKTLKHLCEKDDYTETGNSIQDSIKETSCTVIPVNHFKNAEEAKSFLKLRPHLAAWAIDNLDDADIITMANVIWAERD